MTTEQCYLSFGGDFQGTLQRLGKTTLMNRLLLRFRDTSDFADLRDSLQAGKVEEAFRHAHTLKGVALNLGMTPLAESSSALTELLRAGKLEGSEELFAAVERDWNTILAALDQLDT